MPPASMNTASSAASYGYTPAAPAPAPALAPAPTMPQVAPGMSDLLALLVSADVGAYSYEELMKWTSVRLRNRGSSPRATTRVE